MDISVVLENAILNPDPQERSQAESLLNSLSENNWMNYMQLMTEVLGDESKKTEVRILAGLGIKNQLSSKDSNKRLSQIDRWIKIDQESKNQIKNISLKALLSNDDRVANTAAQLVAAIAEIELPRREWNDLMHIIVENTKADRPVNVKRASLLTIGYICESSDPSNPAVSEQSNGILIAIVQGAQSSEPSVVVRKTALSALINSLEFIARNFDIEGERNYIMQVVCEATQADDTELQALAFGTLAKIMSLYYPYMGVYMEKALYTITVSGMQSPDEKVACMAVEFWSSVCEEEIEIHLQVEEYGDSDHKSYNFAHIALPQVLPTLLDLLTRQNEDAEDDDWTVAMAAGACLQLYAQDTGNYVVQSTLQFVEANLNSENWRNREAAVMAFGSIIDGPDRDQLKSLIGQALPPILNLINDPVLQVKDTVAWCLGRIADMVIDAIDVQIMLPEIIKALLIGLADHPKVSTNCCWTLINLVEQLCSDAANQDESVMSKYYESLVPVLFQISSKSDNEYSARTSAFEALSALVLYSARCDMQIVNQIVNEILTKLDQTIDLQLQYNTTESTATNEDKSLLSDLQSNILNLLTNAIRRVDGEIINASDNLMEKFLRLLQIQDSDSIIDEDVFMAISAIASAINKNFEKYMPAFLPFLTKALENVASPICNDAIGLIVDISHSLGDSFIPYCQGFMAILGSTLSNQNLRRELRPLILSCFGDIASSIGHEFIQYLDVVMVICNTAQTVQPEDNSIQTEDFVTSLKESILDAYVGIIAGLRDFPDAISPYIDQIFELLMYINSDTYLSNSDSVCRAAVGIIGDLLSIFNDGRLRGYCEKEWVADFIKRTRSNPKFSDATKTIARWAREQQKAQI